MIEVRCSQRFQGNGNDESRLWEIPGKGPGHFGTQKTPAGNSRRTRLATPAAARLIDEP